MQKTIAWLFGVYLACTTQPLGAQSKMQITYDLSKIDAGIGWVSSYWGYNAPKLVYDGESFYTVALWGAGSPRASWVTLPRANCVFSVRALWSTSIAAMQTPNLSKWSVTVLMATAACKLNSLKTRPKLPRTGSGLPRADLIPHVERLTE